MPAVTVVVQKGSSWLMNWQSAAMFVCWEGSATDVT